MDNIRHPTQYCSLQATYLPFGYRCNGCHEDGVGPAYHCQTCNFYLHSCCASNTSPLLMHPFHNHYGYALQFLCTPNSHRTNFYAPCNACGRPVCGFGYHCMVPNCRYVLHPCCAHLPLTMPWAPVDLVNSQETGIRVSLSQDSEGVCDRCGVSARGWVYIEPSMNYLIHVGCARETLLEIEASVQALRGTTGWAAPRELQPQRVRHRGGIRRFLRVGVGVGRVALGLLFGDPFNTFGGFVDLIGN